MKRLWWLLLLLATSSASAQQLLYDSGPMAAANPPGILFNQSVSMQNTGIQYIMLQYTPLPGSSISSCGVSVASDITGTVISSQNCVNPGSAAASPVSANRLTISGNLAGAGSIRIELWGCLTATCLGGAGTGTITGVTPGTGLTGGGLAGTVTLNLLPTIASDTTGNAATATALAAIPTQCTGGNVATGISTSGNANCTSVGTGNISNSGTPVSGQLGVWVTSTTVQGVTLLPTAAMPALTGDVTNSAGSLATIVGKINGVTLPTLAASTGLFYDNAGTLSLQATLPTAAVPAFTGDVTNSAGSLATTVGKVNGLTIPASATMLATNSSSQLIALTLLPTSAMPALTGDVTNSAGSLSTTVGKINGVSLASLATGILKNTTITGVPSIAVIGDFPTLNQSTTGNAATATALASTPAQCSSGQFATGITVLGAANCSIPVGSGNVSNSGVPTINQLGVWVTSTTIKGLTTLPTSAMPALTGDVHGSTGTLSSTVVAVNGVSLAGLATGILKNTTATGVPSIAIAADFPTLNQSTTGNAATATALALTPTQCTGGNVATGIAASGNANCTAVGAGNVSNSGTPTVGQLGVWVTATTVQGVTTLPTAAEPAHTGDVTNTAGSLTMTVGKINGVTLPTLTASTGLIYDNAGVLSLQATLPTAAEPAHTGDVTNSAGSLTMTVGKINGVSLAGLATGILKNTTTTGAPSIAIASDFPTLNQSTTGNAATATALAVTPAQCSSGQFATGITAAGVANCSTPAGSGNVSNSGLPTVNQLGVWVTSTTIRGLTTLPTVAMPALTGDVVGFTGTLSTTVIAINGVSLASLATGILKNTTTTGVPSIAVAADFPTLNQSTTGNAATATVATALAVTPAQCTGGQVATGVDASGNANCTSAGTGNVVNSGTPTVNQLAIWTNATAIQGLTVLPAANMPALTGDVTNSAGSLATTVGRINGLAVPLSATLLASNSSRQLTSVSTLPTAAMPALTGDVTNTAGSLATTVVKINGVALPTLTASTGLIYDSSGVLSLQATLPTAAMPALTGDATNSVGSLAMTVSKINGVSLAGLTTGILKNTTTTGAPSIAVAADFPTLNQSTTGNAATATALASTPVQCTGGNVATGIAASGNANCTAVGTGNVSNTGTPTSGQLAVWTSATVVQGVITLPTAAMPALTGDVTNTAGSLSTTVGKINGVTLPTLTAATGLLYDNAGVLSLQSTIPTATMPALTGDVTNSAGSLATTVGKINGVALPTLTASTGILYDTAGVLSLKATLPVAAMPALTGDVTGTVGSFVTTVVKINGVSMAGLVTGILKNTTATGVPSIAIASDFPTLNQSTTGNAATATALASTPAQCSVGLFSTGIAASGNANCGTPAGTVNSVTLNGTANQISVVGTNPITSSGSWTLSLPSSLTIPGKFTSYNGTSLVGLGVPAIYGASNVVSQSASQGTTNIIASTALAGSYMIRYYLDQNAVCSAPGAGQVFITFNWTDASSAHSASTIALPFLSSLSVSAGYLQSVLPIYAALASTISYTTTVTGCDTGTATYDLHVSAEQTQ